MQENRPTGEFVGSVSGDILMELKMQEEQVRVSRKNILDLFTHHQLQYRLDTDSSLFLVDENNGFLRVKNSPDLEELCTSNAYIIQRDQCSKGSLEIMIQVDIWNENKLLGVAYVTIQIFDVDDNAPQFMDKDVSLSLREVIHHKNRVVDLPSAIDRDVSNSFNQIGYKLEPLSERAGATFSLKISPDRRPQLRLMEDLDYEKITNYTMALYAYDANSDYNMIKNSNSSSRLTVQIFVVDINDNEPVFDKSDHTIQVMEDTPVNTVLYKINATDEDASSILTFSLAYENSGPPNCFHVQDDGQVILKRQLDFEKRRQHELVVRVTDGAFLVSTRLVIVVIDTNDEHPQFEINMDKLILEEEKGTNQFIGRVTVSDKDSSSVNGLLQCYEPEPYQPIRFLSLSVNGSQEKVTTRSNRMRYNLFPRVNFDRENLLTSIDSKWIHHSSLPSGPTYITSVLVCQDGLLDESGSSAYKISNRIKSHTASFTVSVFVEDINDNVPRCVYSTKQVDVLENGPMGEKLVQVEGFDVDVGENAELVFELANVSDYFQLDSSSGWITTMSQLDYEVAQRHELKIIISDKGKPPKTSSPCLIVINVVDQNDHAPRLISPQSLAIPENKPPGIVVAHLEAHDDDSGLNARVVFSLIEPNEFFSMASNGTLITQVPLDRESQSQHCFMIEMSNPTEVPQKNQSFLCVDVIDENDNPPRFSLKNDNPNMNISKNGQFVSLSMSRFEKKGFQLSTFSAWDPDESDNAVIDYQIMKQLYYPRDNSMWVGNSLFDLSDSHWLPVDNGIFQVDSKSGAVILQRTLTPNSDVGFYRIILVATDRGVPPLSSSLTINILMTMARSTHGRDSANQYRSNSSHFLSQWSIGQNSVVVIIMTSATLFLVCVLIAAIICIANPCQRKPSEGDMSQSTPLPSSSNYYTTLMYKDGYSSGPNGQTLSPFYNCITQNDKTTDHQYLQMNRQYQPNHVSDGNEFEHQKQSKFSMGTIENCSISNGLNQPSSNQFYQQLQSDVMFPLIRDHDSSLLTLHRQPVAYSHSGQPVLQHADFLQESEEYNQWIPQSTLQTTMGYRSIGTDGRDGRDLQWVLEHVRNATPGNLCNDSGKGESEENMMQFHRDDSPSIQHGAYPHLMSSTRVIPFSQTAYLEASNFPISSTVYNDSPSTTMNTSHGNIIP